MGQPIENTWPAIIADIDALTETQVEAGRQALPAPINAQDRCRPRTACRRRRLATNRQAIAEH